MVRQSHTIKYDPFALRHGACFNPGTVFTGKVIKG